MAASDQKTDTGFFGFFKKKVLDASSAVVPVQEGVVDSLSAMLPLLTTVLEEKFPVQIFLNNAATSFYSHFEWELLEDEKGQVLQSKNYLERGEYLLLAAMDPPIGNLKIRNSTEIRLEFASKHHLIECETTLDLITPARKICLAFPKKLKQKQQQRLAVRVPVERTMTVVASIVRPSGIVFDAKFCDVSSGGAAFFAMGATPRIADHSRVEMTITYPGGKVMVDAVVLGTFSKNGEQVFRAQFLVDSHKTSSDINALVAHVQRENIQRRKKLLQ
ncbi:MAG: PilZ domain-containing protein [Magnetococcales bacterium]|nr:PilZ domain-containing protein [Magnetococcales bacterium]